MAKEKEGGSVTYSQNRLLYETTITGWKGAEGSSRGKKKVPIRAEHVAHATRSEKEGIDAESHYEKGASDSSGGPKGSGTEKEESQLPGGQLPVSRRGRASL